jgi:flagellar secretion chaperone FliS
MLSRDKEHAMGAAIAYGAYRRSEIETLTPRDLLVKLFEGMERFIEQGAMAMQNRHCEMAAKNCQRVRDILFELQSTLNFEAGGEIAKRLDAIYGFMVIEVTEAGLRQDAERLRQLQRVIRPLIDAWKGVPDEFSHTTSLTGDYKQNIISMQG